MRLESEGLSADSHGRLHLSEPLHRQILRTVPIEKDFDIEDEPFARGKKAIVRRCVEKSSGRRLAAKYLKKKGALPCPEMLHEVAALIASRACQHVVSLHSVYQNSQDLVLVLELGEGGELQTVLDRDEVPAEHQVSRVMKQVLQALVYLHGINIVHLDLKPQNVVLMGEFPNCDVKLCDFGISRFLGVGSDVREILGTPDYVAPEVLNYESISLATDMWSVGVLMYVLLSGCSPFGGDTKQETFCNISQCRLDFPDDLFDNISHEAKDLMSKLMTLKPCERLSAEACLKHPWFTKDFGASAPEPVISSIPVPINVTNNNFTPDFKSSSEESTETLVEVQEEIKEEKEEFKEKEEKEGLDRRRKRMEELVKRVRDDEGSLNKSNVKARVESFRCMSRASGMQTMPITGFLKYSTTSNVLSADTLHKFKRIYITDESASPPTSLSAVSVSSSSSGFASADSSCESNSDSVSEMSLDSSSDRSSIISLDDPAEYGFKAGLSLRHYSSCHNVWEAVERDIHFPRECRGSIAKALSKFDSSNKAKLERVPRHPKLTLFTQNKLALPSQINQINKKPPGLELMKERKGNFVIIREMRAINGSRYLRTSELKCESVQSRIKKFDPLKLDISKDIKHEIF